MTINERFKQVRKKQGYTQQQFASKLDTNQQGVADIESGRKNPGIEILEKIHTIFKVNLNWLVVGTGKMKQEYGEKEEIRFSVSEPPADYQTSKLLEAQEKLIRQYENEIERLKAKCGEKEPSAEKQTKP